MLGERGFQFQIFTWIQKFGTALDGNCLEENCESWVSGMGTVLVEIVKRETVQVRITVSDGELSKFSLVIMGHHLTL